MKKIIPMIEVHQKGRVPQTINIFDEMSDKQRREMIYGFGMWSSKCKCLGVHNFDNRHVIRYALKNTIQYAPDKEDWAVQAQKYLFNLRWYFTTEQISLIIYEIKYNNDNNKTTIKDD